MIGSGNSPIRDLLLVNIVFSVLCVVILLVPGLVIGARMFTLVVIYNVMIPVVGYLRNYREWITMWFFAFLLSIFMIWPDWFLSAQLGVLVFPDDGFLMIGPVSGYMAGLWSIPLFVLIFVGIEVSKRRSYSRTYLIIAVLTLLIFGTAEATMWMLPSWYAQNVTMCGHVAVYIILPEILLGLSTFFCFILVRTRAIWMQIVGAFTVMILYMGNISFFYFLIEKVLPSIL
ncbi:MAG: hypothetical protein JSW05_02605 [Candidatus Thorarchaeota archaeon]|nr:MAG: hypothetical protein JSW05_02605 [Candidatus Thorarchaeota archaeon]